MHEPTNFVNHQFLDFGGKLQIFYSPPSSYKLQVEDSPKF